MRWLFAPDSYGGFCSAPEALSLASAQGWLGHPMSDGGEGLLDALRWHQPALSLQTTPTRGPCGSPRLAAWLRTPDGGVIESARVIGPTTGHPCDVRSRSTAGLAALLATRRGPTIVGLGGSATVDGGRGALAALGEADLSDVVVWCDVQTPLTECMARFGPQKGLSEADVAAQTRAVLAWAGHLNEQRARRGLPPLPLALPGGGAAGGLGFALAARGARLVRGAHAFAERTRLDEAIAGCDGVILGEGRLDAGSFAGKVAGEVCGRARQAGKRVAALVGRAESVPPPPIGPDIVVETGEASAAAFQAAARRLAEELR